MRQIGKTCSRAVRLTYQKPFSELFFFNKFAKAFVSGKMLRILTDFQVMILTDLINFLDKLYVDKFKLKGWRLTRSSTPSPRRPERRSQLWPPIGRKENGKRAKAQAKTKAKTVKVHQAPRHKHQTEATKARAKVKVKTKEGREAAAPAVMQVGQKCKKKSLPQYRLKSPAGSSKEESAKMVIIANFHMKSPHQPKIPKKKAQKSNQILNKRGLSQQERIKERQKVKTQLR